MNYGARDRHRKLWAELVGQIVESERFTLVQPATRYDETTPYGDVEFLTEEDRRISAAISKGEVSFSNVVALPSGGDWLASRMNLNSSYRLTDLAPRDYLDDEEGYPLGSREGPRQAVSRLLDELVERDRKLSE